MDIKALYESRYACTDLQKFEDYERNRLLTRCSPLFCKAGMRILDLGCRDLDISENALGLARKRGLQDLQQGDIEKPLPYKDEAFDLVFWGDNVEHLFEPLKALNEIHRVLKRNGTMILSAPNMGCIWLFFYWYDYYD
jgi:SAM-dependent methyltransferase